MGDIELLAIKLAVEERRHLLEGAEKPFIVWTDCKYIQTNQAAQFPTGQLGFILQ